MSVKNFFRYYREQTRKRRNLPLNAYPPVYESDEQLRLQIALGILATSIGVAALATQIKLVSAIINLGIGILALNVILGAMLYIMGTATRLRYQNPGEAQLAYVSESSRRDNYDSMVESFWNMVLLSLLFGVPSFALVYIKTLWLGIVIAIVLLLMVVRFVTLLSIAGVIRDEAEGNLVYDHFAKGRSSKYQREPHAAPAVIRTNTVGTK